METAALSLESLGRGFMGILILIFIAYALSANRRAIQWKTVGLGLGVQLIIAIGVLKIGWVTKIFETMGNFFVNVLEYTGAGTAMLLGEFANVDRYGFIFLFQALPVIIFFSALTSVLYYFGIIQKIVGFLAWGLTKLLHISGAESLSVAGNIFLGQTEAPLLIKAYLEKMNRSEIFLVMVGGMATVAGSVLGAYIGFLGGNDPVQRLEFAKTLLAASVMAAPGAVVISKIMYPQTETVATDVHIANEKIGSNLLTAISNGTSEGIKMAVNVGAMLLVFIALIAMLNGILAALGGGIGVNSWIAAHTPYNQLSIELLLGYLFAPLMWLIGVAKEDITLVGQLLGVKLVASEFVGYTQLAELKNATEGLFFTHKKSIIMSTYILREEVDKMIAYTDEYIETIDWVYDMFFNQYERWEQNNDSIYIDFMPDDEEPDGKYYFPPMANYTQRMPFSPPRVNYDAIKLDGTFRLLPKEVGLKMTDIYDGTDLGYLMENTTSIEARYVNQFIDRVGNKWVYDLDIVDLDDNEFWIKNRRYIQKDKLIKYNLFKRLELWEYDIKEQLQAYKQELVESTEMLDSVIAIRDSEIEFIWWVLNPKD